MTAGSDREIGGRRFSFHFNLLQHATKFTLGRQNPSDALEHAEISFVERVLSREWCLPWVTRTPRTEGPFCVDLSGRNGIGQLCSE